MQFSKIIIALLPALGAVQASVLQARVAQASTPVVSSNALCSNDNRLTCAASTDGVRRCLNLGGGGSGDLCVVDCGSQTACRASCANAGFVNGFCTTGNNPCICSNVDGGSGK